MLLASQSLAVLALLLAWPVPVALSRANWPSRAPIVALLVWQAVALAGGLSMIGAMALWGLQPLGTSLLDALATVASAARGTPPPEVPDPARMFALSAAALLGAHLLLTLARTAWRTSRQRARHRQLLSLLAERSDVDPGTLVLDHDTPVAYCLPGLNSSVTVLSRGLLHRLGEDELSAVLAHEAAHLSQRHHLLLLAFLSWQAALPWLPTARLSLRSVRELVEMLADDAALRHVERPVLLHALLTVAAGSADEPHPDHPAGQDSTVPAGQLSSRRLRRLASL